MSVTQGTLCVQPLLFPDSERHIYISLQNNTEAGVFCILQVKDGMKCVSEKEVHHFGIPTTRNVRTKMQN